MKRGLLLFFLFVTLITSAAWSQCGRVSLIGEFNGWADDYYLIRFAESPADFHVIITVDESDDTEPAGAPDGIVHMKFRENADWTVNWGSDQFPSGTATAGGPNIPVTYGSWVVTFNCETGVYNFAPTCGTISMIGEFNEWAGDHYMTRIHGTPDSWYTTVFFTEDDDTSDPPDGIVELKFRENMDWTVNWGSSEFPSGTGTQGGVNIPVPVGGYFVTFNCATGAYTFTSTCGEIGLIGEMTAWGDDLWMERSMTNPDVWTYMLTLNDEDDTSDPPDGIVEMKFRQNADWGTNWGAADFPEGVGLPGGANIPVPLDGTGLTTDYKVTFNCATGDYFFLSASGAISIIGAFNGWNGDIPMNRDAANPNLWKLSRSWYADSEIKFRENKDWSVNWGDNTFPSGIGVLNGLNIPLTAGKYDVTFDANGQYYSFLPNNEICGEIGIIGEFNTYGDDGSGTPTDVWMVRDPMYPSNFSIEYNFTASDNIWFRLDADPLYDNVFGGSGFPVGVAQMGSTAPYIQVPGGKYIITFNCKSYEYSFTRLGNAVIAPQVFTMNPADGMLTEADWDISQNISQIVDGTPTEDVNEAYFGVAYNDEYLYVGLSVKDAILQAGEEGEVFVDGNKSGGAYDEFDVHLKFGAAGLTVIQGPAGIEPILGFALTADGYTAEVAIPWADLGVEPAEGGQIGFDIILGDDDDGTGVAYRMAWNGGLQNYDNTSSFGDLLFGTLSCGSVSLYSSTIGDVGLQKPTAEPTTYVGTYNLDQDQNLVFRKDKDETVSWGGTTFPTGTAAISGGEIPATTGRYRISFDCVTGEYSFTTESDAEGVAFADYTDTPPTIDGDLSEYNLQYGSTILAAGAGPINNTVAWGAAWDMNNLYFGAEVTDAVVEGAGNPWDNDAIEFYIDGNHDSDGTYDGEFDTQLILDALNESTLWIKADGVQIEDYESIWTATGTGYKVELRLGWADFQFAPGKGRTMGFSLGNNDSDNGTGRDYQSVWFGTENNWSNTGDLGDLQLAGGPYFFSVREIEDFSSYVVLFPNPARGNVYLQLEGDVFSGNVNLYVTDLSGRTVNAEQVSTSNKGALIMIDADNFKPGIYFVNILDENGKRAVKKLIVQ